MILKTTDLVSVPRTENFGLRKWEALSKVLIVRTANTVLFVNEPVRNTIDTIPVCCEKTGISRDKDP